MDIFSTLVVTSENVAAARDVGVGMFTAGASATPEGPATHYISSGYLPESLLEELTPLCAIISLSSPLDVLQELGLSLVY